MTATLSEGGACVIGDIGFADATARDLARQRFASRWDPYEHYLAAAELADALGHYGLRVEWEQVSAHAGVVVVDGDPTRNKGTDR